MSTTSILAQPVQFLKGIGERRAEALSKYGVKTLNDLLFYIPRRYLDRTSIVTIAELRTAVLQRSQQQPDSASVDVQKDYTVVGDVRSFRVMGIGKKSRFVLILGDSSGTIQLVWFGGVNYWKTKFAVGETLAVSGQPTSFGSVLQFVHPDVDKIAEKALLEEKDHEPVDWTQTLSTGGLVPLYPSGKELERVGLDSSGFRRIIGGVIRRQLESVPETLAPSLLSSRKLCALQDAIRSAHFPREDAEIPESLRRMKYEELFYFQLKLALKRHGVKTDTHGIVFNVQSKLARQLVDSLPFKLTPAQIRVINEITDDMSSSKPMNRLLQGDVGSGKTIVALISLLIAVENGYQAVFMAPTEILAEQHHKTIASLLKGIDVNVRLLVGGQRTKLRRDVLDDVQRGSAQIVVGTHALFEKGVEFAKLGYVVIDEQHRFGVLQRQSLQRKGSHPDVLVMTATPIPRTLSLTVYGDLDVSVINELPAGRKPIKTVLRYEEENAAVFKFVRDEVQNGRQAYFVYPLVEESEKVDLKAATEHYEYLQAQVFPELKLGLLHGRMPSDEKDNIMQRFKNRELDILVATTVIEVGIDVPNASIMVIENAERFGLSQLHQLRGRVGRGSEQSFCILLSKKWITTKANRLTLDSAKWHEALDQQRLAERRLATMVQTNDGFKIAEVDLQLRGPGDFFGTRQSGIPEFKVADILSDITLLDEARRDAFALIEHDPQLKLPEHHVIAEHLRAIHRDAFALMKVA